jgi:hypothetical protein
VWSISDKHTLYSFLGFFSLSSKATTNNATSPFTPAARADCDTLMSKNPFLFRCPLTSVGACKRQSKCLVRQQTASCKKPKKLRLSFFQLNGSSINSDGGRVWQNYFRVHSISGLKQESVIKIPQNIRPMKYPELFLM